MNRLSVLLLVAACGSSTPTPAPVTTNEMPLPDAAAAAPAAPATPELEPGVSLGGVRIGMAREETRRILGTPSVQEDPAAEFDQYYEKGLSLAFGADEKLEAIHAFSGEQGGYETEPWQRYELRAPKGITFDSSYDQVMAAWGEPSSQDGLPAAPIPSRWAAYSGVMFDFITSNGHLFHVVVSSD